MRKKISILVLAAACSAMVPSGSIAQTVMIDEAVLKAMQEQIAAQAKAINELQKALKAQEEKLENLPALTAMIDPPEQTKAVTSKIDKVKVGLYGQINTAVMFADDGNDDDVFFVDNDTSSTRFGLTASVKANEEFSAGAHMEYEFQENPSNKVSMSNQSVSGSLEKRKILFFVKSESYGNLTVGHGPSASDGVTEMDLSGTTLAGYVKLFTVGGGLLFYDKNIGEYSSTSVNSSYNNLDGLGRINMVRYDTPEFYGFTLSGSTGENNQNDVAVRYRSKYKNFTVNGGVAWAYTGSGSSSSDQLSGSASVLFNNGFNIALAGGSRNETDFGKDDPWYYYGKIGYKFSACRLGQTSASLDYGRFEAFAANNDVGDAYGVQFVQEISDLSTEIYLSYRLYSLDRDGTDFDDIKAMISGFRIKF